MSRELVTELLREVFENRESFYLEERSFPQNIIQVGAKLNDHHYGKIFMYLKPDQLAVFIHFNRYLESERNKEFAVEQFIFEECSDEFQLAKAKFSSMKVFIRDKQRENFQSKMEVQLLENSECLINEFD